MFWGSFNHVLDDKGRTSLPKEFRQGLSTLDGSPWITAWPHCLAILTEHAFEALRSRLTGEGSDYGSIQKVQRLIIGMAHRCSIDKQGRFLVPPTLREWAGLERNIVLSGVGDRIEVWDRSRHAQELEDARLNYDRYSRDIERKTPEAG